MKNKLEVPQIFKNFKTIIKNQFQTSIQILRIDNGREFFNSSLGSYLSTEGIIHQSSWVDTPQQNGIVERKKGHLLAVTRVLLFHNNVPKHYWEEATLTATYLINWLPSRSLNSNSPI